MKNKYKKHVPVYLAVFILACAFVTGFGLNRPPETKYINASWSYNYADIKEISKVSDLIAIVHIEKKASEYEKQEIPFTEYTASVMKPVYNSSAGQEVTIVMTGANNSNTHIEIADDPLLTSGEEFLIFAKHNTDDTYTILSGPQGRLVYSNGKLNSLQAVNARDRANNTDGNINVVNADAEEMCSKIRGYLNLK